MTLGTCHVSPLVCHVSYVKLYRIYVDMGLVCEMFQYKNLVVSVIDFVCFEKRAPIKPFVVDKNVHYSWKF